MHYNLAVLVCIIFFQSSTYGDANIRLRFVEKNIITEGFGVILSFDGFTWVIQITATRIVEHVDQSQELKITPTDDHTCWCWFHAFEFQLDPNSNQNFDQDDRNYWIKIEKNRSEVAKDKNIFITGIFKNKISLINRKLRFAYNTFTGYKTRSEGLDVLVIPIEKTKFNDWLSLFKNTITPIVELLEESKPAQNVLVHFIDWEVALIGDWTVAFLKYWPVSVIKSGVAYKYGHDTLRMSKCYVKLINSTEVIYAVGRLNFYPTEAYGMVWIKKILIHNSYVKFEKLNRSFLDGFNRFEIASRQSQHPNKSISKLAAKKWTTIHPTTNPSCLYFPATSQVIIQFNFGSKISLIQGQSPTGIQQGYLNDEGTLLTLLDLPFTKTQNSTHRVCAEGKEYVEVEFSDSVSSDAAGSSDSVIVPKNTDKLHIHESSQIIQNHNKTLHAYQYECAIVPKVE